jgi:ATP synthase protein I
MKILPPPLQDEDFDPKEQSAEPPVRRWSAQEIAQLQQHRTYVSPWRVVAWQWAVLVVLTMASALMNTQWAASVAWGAMSAALPSTVMAWGLRSLPAGAQGFPAGAHILRFAVWELVKIALSVMLLVAAHWVVPAVNWLALVIAFVITLKVLWWVALRGSLRPR